MHDKVGNSFIWHEKYQPTKIEDAILPKQLKDDFTKMIADGKFEHLLFSGNSGVGKSTVAKILCKQLNLDYLFINASIENGIDVLRTKIQDFASSISLNDTHKVVILDEGDYLNKDSTQPALRGFMDEFNVSFIVTCNFPNRFIEPLLKRFNHYTFNVSKAEKPELMKQMFDRVIEILNLEKVTFDEKAVVALVKTEFPNLRKTLIDLQKYSKSGHIDAGILANSEASFKTLIDILKKKQFGEMRKWVSDNADMNRDKLFADLYAYTKHYMQDASVPQLVLTLADYQYKSCFAVNQEINTAAMLTDIMASCNFKD